MECRLVSCLEKIFYDGRGASASLPPLSALQGERIAFQCAIFCEYYTYVFPRIQGNLPGKATIHHVECVPARMGRKEQISAHREDEWDSKHKLNKIWQKMYFLLDII